MTQRHRSPPEVRNEQVGGWVEDEGGDKEGRGMVEQRHGLTDGFAEGRSEREAHYGG